jgi:hypothetical protein
MSRLTLVTACLAGIALAACADSVTAPSAPRHPDAPRAALTTVAAPTAVGIAFAPDAAPTANRLTFAYDDQIVPGVPIGFPFKFFGTSYETLMVSSNGFVHFPVSDTDAGYHGCCSGWPMPQVDNVFGPHTLDNLIAVVWGDWDVRTHGAVTYETRGVAPDRRFVLEFSGVPESGGIVGTPGALSAQLILHERSNRIEVHTRSLTHSGQRTITQGVENAEGTAAAALTGRIHSAGFPALTNDAVCFTTNGNASDCDQAQSPAPGFAWTGFLSPIDNGVVNVTRAGSAIPVKFSLGGDHGLGIFAPGYPKALPIACEANQPTDQIEQTVTAGASALSYDALSDRYTYVWKTEKSWANSCRTLVVKLTDGSEHTADFKFTR